jgi:hypothetical protein
MQLLGIHDEISIAVVDLTYPGGRSGGRQVQAKAAEAIRGCKQQFENGGRITLN